MGAPYGGLPYGKEPETLAAKLPLDDLCNHIGPAATVGGSGSYAPVYRRTNRITPLLRRSGRFFSPHSNA